MPVQPLGLDGLQSPPDTLTNGNYKVDVNRGCQIRMDRATGAAVYMFYDQPGVFLNDHGKVVPPEFAERAGYDVEPLLKLRRKHLALIAAHQEIERQYTEARTHEVVAEYGEYRVVHIGNEQYQVEFEDGTAMGRPVAKDVAMSTFRMVSGAPEAEAVPAPAADQSVKAKK
jgi:hypothetical protein